MAGDGPGTPEEAVPVGPYVAHVGRNAGESAVMPSPPAMMGRTSLMVAGMPGRVDAGNGSGRPLGATVYLAAAAAASSARAPVSIVSIE